MKHKKICIGILIAFTLLSGCRKNPDKVPESPDFSITAPGENTSEPSGSTTVPSAVPEPNATSTPIPTIDPVKEIISQYETYKFGSHVMEDNDPIMISNSNHGNLGYLCEALDGSVYFADPADGILYRSNADGTERICILKRNVSNLCIHDKYLYFRDGDTAALYCYDLETKVLKQILEDKIGEFILLDNMIYYTRQDGICQYDLESGSTKLLVAVEKFFPIWMSITKEAISFVATDLEDPSFASRGLLFLYCFDDQTTYYVGENFWMPALIGSQLLYQGRDSALLTSLDLNTGNIRQYSAETARASANTEEIYYTKPGSLECCHRLTGETELLLSIEAGLSINYHYQTSTHLYLYTSRNEIIYYNIADRTSGIFPSAE